MIYRLKLKNAAEEVLIDEKVIDYLSSDPYLKSVDILNNLRKHSSGCAVFQKTTKKAEGGYSTKTIYLHKLIAEHFLLSNKTNEKDLVAAENGNKLDCRIENICWRSRSVASRLRKTSAKSGYTGVYLEGNRYRAVISVNRKSIHIGMYQSAEEAAMAYNAKSIQLFGSDGKLNVINTPPAKAETQVTQTAGGSTTRIGYINNQNPNQASM